MSVSSLLLRSSIAGLACLSLLVTKVTGATYELQDTYAGPSFFDAFNFFTGHDPTNGFVSYVDEATALSSGLLIIPSSDLSPAVFGVDYTNTLSTYTSRGRASVRISSKQSYTHALIISDIAHMPGGICGTWPAHWTLGPNWPTNGEIDIIEGVNNAAVNLMSLHTSPGCTDAGANEVGTLQTSNCDTSVNFNSGCGVTADTTASYGSGFNGGSGGVYATEWTSSYIKIWFFPTGSVPADIAAGIPDPTGWGLPQANFAGTCDIDSHFKDHNIIFDTTFCGDYGNAEWNNNAACQAIAGAGSTCNSYVANNPSAFANAFWSVNSIKVYQQSGNSSFSSTTTAPPTSSSTPLSSILAPGMGDSTASLPTSGNFTRPGATSTTSSAPYQAATASSAAPTTTNPSSIGAFIYIGCLGSTSGFSSFIQVENNPLMTLDLCTTQCSNSQFMGVFNTICFCADTIDSGTSIAAADGLQCKNPCPGNLNELCGGSRSTSRLAVRQASNGILLTVYENTNFALVSVPPASATFGYGMGGGAAVSAITSIVLATSYVDVCDVCLGGYQSIMYTTTIAQCGCVANEHAGLLSYGAMSSAPHVPMTAVETVCSSCGSNGAAATVTVTLPAAVVAIASVSSILATATVTGAVAGNIVEEAAGVAAFANSTVCGGCAAATGVAGVAGVTVTTTGGLALFTGGGAGAGSFSGSMLGLVVGGAAAMLML
ncbi:MAG: hypothetical protein M1818_002303 [Claussenomyces sp. TS43310]|nr:MAG: hypothetical protein M1818_002303 [Claussenomyces sp. TS43310]